ncbi:MAG: right-handed parallel beta-helix repeat-containing protein [Promethearchaeota archaeon]
MRKRYFQFLTIVILCFFPLIKSNSATSLLSENLSFEWQNNEVSMTLAQLTPHAPINITSDSQFELLGFPGNGSEDEPFLIKDLEIEGSPGVDCISISGSVLSHYEIRGCHLSDSTTGVGIRLGAGHGTVESCEIYNCNTGVLLESNGHRIRSSEIHNNSIGFSAEEVDDVRVEASTFYENSGIGPHQIIFDEISGLTIKDNSFSDSIILIGSCIGTTVSNNIFHIDESAGYLSIQYSQDCTVDSNTFDLNGLPGIILTSSENITIIDCDFVVGPNRGGGLGIDFGSHTLRDITIQRCTFISASCAGLNVEEGLLITECSFTNGSIDLQNSHSAEISSNVINGGYIDIEMNCTNSVIFNNSLVNSFGVRVLVNNEGVIVSSNSIIGFGSGNGLQIESDNIVVRFNSIENFDYGISIEDSSSCAIYNNTIFDNNLGIKIGVGCSSHTLYYNILYYNIQNANDDGTNNIWDDGVSLGNYWGNLDAPGEYVIPGSAESVDRYARPYRIPIIPPTPLVLLIIVGAGVVGVVVAVVCLRRR